MTTASGNETGTRLREARQRAGLSVRQLKPYSPAYVSRVERGLQPGSPEFWATMASITGASLQWLLHGTEPGALALTAARVALADGDVVAARRSLRRIMNDPGEPAVRAHAGRLLADSYYEEQSYGESAAILLHVLDECEPVGEEGLLLRLRLVRALLEAGDTAGAVFHGNLALERAVQLGTANTVTGVRLRATLADALMEQESWELAEHVLRAAQEESDGSASYAIWWNLAVLALERGGFEEAVSYAQSAERALDDQPDDPLRLQQLVAEIEIRRPAGDLGRADRILNEVESVARLATRRLDLGCVLVDKALLELRRGRPEAAEERAGEAISHLSGNTRKLIEAQTWLAIALIRRGTLGRALRILDDATAAGTSIQAARMWHHVAPELETAGHTAEALRAYHRGRLSRSQPLERVH